MAQRVAAIFGSREAAQRAADALADLGADREHISTLARGDEGTVTTTTATERHDGDEVIAPAREVGDSGAALTTTEPEDVVQGAATGAVLGAVAGVAAGLAVLIVPGFGLVAGAGPLLLALGGASAAAGAVAGGVYGGLRDLGIEEPYARGYEERIRSGDVLLTAVVPAMFEDRVLDVLAEQGAEDVSFVEDATVAEMPVGAGLADPMITDRADRIMTTPSTVGSVDTPAMTAPPADVLDPRTTMTSPPDVDLAEPRTTMTSPPAPDLEEQRASIDAPSASSVETSVTTTGYNPDIARGEAKQAEGEMRDRAGDFTENPLDDVTAKGKKLEGKIQEEYGEAEEAVRDRRA